MGSQDDIILEKLRSVKLQQADYKGVSISDNAIEIDIVLFSPVMHIKKTNEYLIKESLKEFDKKVFINSEIGENPTRANSQKSDDKLSNIKNILAIASGKGGVGKSTVTASIALKLRERGYKVGIVDADIYGPSIPKIFGVEHESPLPSENEAKKMSPILLENEIKIMSIGFFTDTNRAIVWRGPMASNALKQMLFDTDWQDLDYLLIDLPPGTGDIHLSIVQFLPLDGVVIVSTPQDMSVLDARRGLQMFKQESINVPILGLIENMAYFTPEELPTNKYYIFGKDGVKNLSKETKSPFLGEIPITMSIREDCDNGKLSQNKDKIFSDVFTDIVDNLLENLNFRNSNLPPTKKVEITNTKGCS